MHVLCVLHYTSAICNPIIPLLRFVLDLFYNLFLHRCAAVDKILTDTSRRGSRVLVIIIIILISDNTA